MSSGFSTADELLLEGCAPINYNTTSRSEADSSEQQAAYNKNKIKWAKNNGTRFCSLLIGVSFGAWHIVGNNEDDVKASSKIMLLQSQLHC